MSIWSRQQTCAACGCDLYADEQMCELVILVDGVIRYVAVHRDCRIDVEDYPRVA